MPHCEKNRGTAFFLWNSLWEILGLYVEKDCFRALIAHINVQSPSWAKSDLPINISRILLLGRYLQWGHLKGFVLLMHGAINKPSAKYIIRSSVLIIIYSRWRSNGTVTFPSSGHASCSPLFLNLPLEMQRPLISHLTVILACLVFQHSSDHVPDAVLLLRNLSLGLEFD